MNKLTAIPTLISILNTYFGHRYCIISLIIAQSAFRWTLFDFSASARVSFCLNSAGAAATFVVMAFVSPSIGEIFWVMSEVWMSFFLESWNARLVLVKMRFVSRSGEL
jgi:hypothetical protein